MNLILGLLFSCLVLLANRRMDEKQQPCAKTTADTRRVQMHHKFTLCLPTSLSQRDPAVYLESQ